MVEHVIALGRYQRLRKGLLGLAIACFGAASLFVQSAAGPNTVAHDAVFILGLTLIFAGIVGRLWSTLYVGGHKISRLVTSGPYSVTRNPLYFFSTVAAAGVGALTGSVTMMIAFGAFCATAFHVVMAREEAALHSLHGEAYPDYMARVPRFWPSPSSYLAGETSGFDPRLLKRTLLDSTGFLAAVPLFKAVEHAQAAGLLPVLLRLP